MVHPLGVIDDAQQRPLFGHVRQEGQRRQTDQEAVGDSA